MYKYKALLINCMDPRLDGENEIKIATAAGLKSCEYEMLNYPGPSLWMTEPHEPEHSKEFWWTLEHVSLPVHNISTIVVVGHSNCGGFALKGAPKEKAQEKEVIIASLKQAALAIKQKHPELEVLLLFVEIGEDKEDALPEITIEQV